MLTLVLLYIFIYVIAGIFWRTAFDIQCIETFLIFFWCTKQYSCVGMGTQPAEKHTSMCFSN